MKILVVGAGAVGQTYGYYLQKGGAEVTFYIKEKYRETLNVGLQLFPMNQGKNPSPINFKDYGIISSDQVVAQTKWDAVVLTLSSDILYTPWLQQFASQVNKDATIVTLQPGLTDREELKKYFAEESLVTGVITLIAYATPMGSSGPRDQGMAYWFPPLAKAPFQGATSRVRPIVETLSRARFPAAIQAGAQNPLAIAYASTFLSTFVLTLENYDWKLGSLMESGPSKTLTSALKESFLVIATKFKTKAPMWSFILGRWFYIILIKICLKIMPFDLETYLQVHFTKVSVQMKMNMQELLDEAKALNISTPTLSKFKM